MKGRTKWFPRSVHPVRTGEYECAVKITSSAPAIAWKLEWDGIGFRVPCPMVVLRWRGMTRAEHIRAVEAHHGIKEADHE